MFEGGLRQASIARWPGKVTAGRVSDEPWAFWDFMPTVAEITGAKIPATWKSNGLSLVDFLKGGKAPQRPFFYGELHEGQPSQAIRFGDWKAVRPAPNKPMLLFDLKTDSAETQDLAAEHPELVKKAVDLMNGYRTADPNWPDPAGVAGKRSK
jgi:arylsulfatase A-like enzyme